MLLIDSKDIYTHALNIHEENDVEKWACDINGNNKIDNIDDWMLFGRNEHTHKFNGQMYNNEFDFYYTCALLIG